MRNLTCSWKKFIHDCNEVSVYDGSSLAPTPVTWVISSPVPRRENGHLQTVVEKASLFTE